jgi:beta-mannosidase
MIGFFSKKKILISCVFFLSLFLFFSCQQKSTGEKILFTENWEFYFEDNDEWYPATVPGNIHTDLFNNGLIPDPFIATNENSLQWIGERNWKYRCSFMLKSDLSDQNFEMVFEGLDTHAEIFINDYFIGSTNNMFRLWSFEVPDSILDTENVLNVNFLSVAENDRQKLSQVGIAIPDERVFSRKSPYHGGWDWAPKYQTVGIYKDVYLQYWEKLRILDIKLEQDVIADTVAYLTAFIKLESENYYNGSFEIISPENKFDTIKYNLEIFEGIHTYPVLIEINNPVLWWCNGLGDAHLYNFKFEVRTKFRLVSETVQTGIRKIDLVTNLDDDGQSFYFILNGLPVFAKGANWVPAEYFNGSNTEQNYRELLIMAKNANFNMLRVWGGGIYENDEFYRLCDSLGIMVWQDFMFACAFYPGDDKFIENVKQEIKYQVNRLYNHPSIVLWCGNNEISNAWFDWGYQQQFGLSLEDSIKIYKDYDKVFHKVIPSIISEIDKSREYTPSSPFFGWGHKESRTHGTSHYWGVWWGMHDFENYYENTGRFMTEYGFQGIPQFNSLERFIPADSLFKYSESVKAHQKHPFGFEAIADYMERYFSMPESFEDYIYLSQLLQAEAIQTALDAHLSAMPYCMGSLFWQFNDCLPIISWSAVDYYKNPKAVYYIAKKSFVQNHIAVKQTDSIPELFVVNHLYKTIDSRLDLKLISFEGDTLFTDNKNAIVPIFSSIKFKMGEIPDSVLINYKNKYFYLLKLYDLDSKEKIAERVFVPGRPKYRELPESQIHYSVKKLKSKWEIKVKSPVFLNNLYIYCNRVNGSYSDNYLNLLPNIEKTIVFTPEDTKTNPQFHFKSLNDLIVQEKDLEDNELSEYNNND